MTRWFSLLTFFTLSLLASAETQKSFSPNLSATGLMPMPVLAQATPAAPGDLEVGEADSTTPGKMPQSSDEFERRFREMNTPAKIVYFAGLLLCVIGGIWMIVRGFQESIGWGIALILCGFASLIFLFMHWSRAKGPFFLELFGLVLILVALLVMA